MKSIIEFIKESANQDPLVEKILSSFDLGPYTDKKLINAIQKWIKNNNVIDVIPAARKDELDSWRFIDDMDKNLYNDLIKNEKLLDKYNFKDLKLIYKDGDIQELADNDDQDGIALSLCAGKDWISYSLENLEGDFLQIFCLKNK